MIKCTFILRDLTEYFYTGWKSVNEGMSLVGLSNLANDRERFNYLNKCAQERILKITSKIGDNSFRVRVDLNAILRDATLQPASYKLEDRKGYKLATFEFKAAA